MWRLVSIKSLSPSNIHKFVAEFKDKDTGKMKKTKFGRRPYQDYTIHKDRQRRELYRLRHEKDLLTKDPTRAGYLSYYLLWGDSTSLQKNIQEFKKKFNLS